MQSQENMFTQFFGGGSNSQIDQQRLNDALRYMAKEKLTQQITNEMNAEREAKWKQREEQEKAQEDRRRTQDAWGIVRKDLRKKGVETEALDAMASEAAAYDTYNVLSTLWNESPLSNLFNYKMKDAEQVTNEMRHPATRDQYLEAISKITGAIKNKNGENVTEDGETVETTTDTTNTSTAPTTEEDTADYVEYTYKPGDTFGQVVKNLGLESGNGLWGDNGDVEYYSKQLEDQLWKSGVWDLGTRQNIPVGTTIRLKRRALTPEMQAYYNKYGYNN